MDEIVGHAYLFLKEQLELSTMPPPSGVLHGTIIGMFSTFFFLFLLFTIIGMYDTFCFCVIFVIEESFVLKSFQSLSILSNDIPLGIGRSIYCLWQIKRHST